MSEYGELFVITPIADGWRLTHDFEEGEEQADFGTLAEAKAKAQGFAAEQLTWRELDSGAWEASAEDEFNNN